MGEAQLQHDESRQTTERRKPGRAGGRRQTDTPGDPPPPWSTTQLARRLGVSHDFITNEINAGEVNAYRIGPYYRITFDEVCRYCRQMGVPPPETRAQEITRLMARLEELRRS